MAQTNENLPKVAIVGRPNVGKSSLFNRIVKMRKAIVYREVGTTRDRISQEVSFNGKDFVLTDTGGFAREDDGKIFKLVKQQIKNTILESDVLLFVCDGQDGLTAQDLELAKLVRKANKRIFLVINKVDNEKIGEQISDFYELGFGNLYPVSVLHNIGVNELMNDLVGKLPEQGAEAPAQEKPGVVKVAIVGRPNSGKSSFLNHLLNEERAIVDEIPGTTRDTLDTYFKDSDTEFILIDTAGLRHKKKIKEAVDVYSIMRTKEAIKRSQICLVLIDGYQGLVSDDARILDLVIDEGKACILCVNKWDLVKDVPTSKYKEMIYERTQFMTKYPIIFTSAKTGYNVYQSLGVIKAIIKNSYAKVQTQQLNRLLNNIKLKGPFRSRANKLKLSYMTQTRVSPPTFLIFVNNTKVVSEEHTNFLENVIRNNFCFFGVPIKFEFRRSKE